MGGFFEYTRNTVTRCSILIVLSLLLVVCSNTYGEGKEYNSFEDALSEYRAIVNSEWAEIGDFSYENRLFSFAREDDSHIPQTSEFYRKRIYPDVPPPEGSRAIYTRWAKMRHGMAETIAKAATQLLSVTTRLFPDYAAIAANEVLIENPNDTEARRILGHHYCSELGWVSGDEKNKVLSGLLPYKNRWQKRESVAEKRRSWENAWELSSQHFRLRTTCDPLAGRQALKFLEHLLSAFRREFHFALTKNSCMFSVNLFRDSSDYESVAKKYCTGPLPCAFYCEKTGETYIDARIGPNGWLFDPVSVAHETVHQLSHSLCTEEGHVAIDKPGAWVCEGLANHCEIFDYFEDRIVFTGYERPVFLQILRKAFPESKMDLSALVGLRVSDFCTGNASMENRCYSELLTSYVINAANGRYRPGYYKYLQLVMSGKGSLSAFSECFDIDPHELDEAFGQWVKERWVKTTEKEYNIREITRENTYNTRCFEPH